MSQPPLTQPSSQQAAHRLGLQLDLLGYGKRVVYLDTEIAHRAFQLRLPEKQLHGSQVARFLIDLCRLGPSHRMRAIGRAVKPSARDPSMDDPGILPGRQVWLRSDSAGKEIPVVPVSNVGKPRLDRGSGLLGDLELHRPARLLLNDGCAVTDPTADADIIDLQPHEIAAPEFAVNCEVEQGEVAGSALDLESDPDRPHVLRLQRALLSNKAAFVPWIATRHRRLAAIEHDRLLGTVRALPAPVRSRPAGHSMPVAGLLLRPTRSSSVADVPRQRIRAVPMADRVMTVRRPCKLLVAAARCARR